MATRDLPQPGLGLSLFPGPLVALGREKALKIANIVLAHPGERENVSGFDLMI